MSKEFRKFRNFQKKKSLKWELRVGFYNNYGGDEDYFKKCVEELYNETLEDYFKKYVEELYNEKFNKFLEDTTERIEGYREILRYICPDPLCESIICIIRAFIENIKTYQAEVIDNVKNNDFPDHHPFLYVGELEAFLNKKIKRVMRLVYEDEDPDMEDADILHEDPDMEDVDILHEDPDMEDADILPVRNSVSKFPDTLQEDVVNSVTKFLEDLLDSYKKIYLSN